MHQLIDVCTGSAPRLHQCLLPEGRPSTGMSPCNATRPTTTKPRRPPMPTPSNTKPSSPSSRPASAGAASRARRRPSGRLSSRPHSSKVNHKRHLIAFSVRVYSSIDRTGEVQTRRVQIDARARPLPDAQQVRRGPHLRHYRRTTHAEASRQPHPAAARHQLGQTQ